METGYTRVMRLAVEDPQWLPLVKAASEFARELGNHFSGKWILERAQAGWFPNLKPLVTREILEKEYSNASGRKAYYRLRDVDATNCALRELGLITL